MPMVIHRGVPLEWDKSEKNHTGFEITALEPTGGTHPITWGEPAQICVAVIDRACPRCGMKRADGFDMGRTQDKAIFGGRCPDEANGCGYTFVRLLLDDDPPRANKARKGRTRRPKHPACIS